MSQRISRRLMIDDCIDFDSKPNSSNLLEINTNYKDISKSRSSLEFLTDMIETVKEFRQLSHPSPCPKSSSHSKEMTNSILKPKVKLIRSHNKRLYTLMNDADRLKADIDATSNHINFIIQRDPSKNIKQKDGSKHSKQEISVCNSQRESSTRVQKKNSDCETSLKSIEVTNKTKPTLLCNKRMIKIEESAIKRKNLETKPLKSIDLRSNISFEFHSSNLNEYNKSITNENSDEKSYNHISLTKSKLNNRKRSSSIRSYECYKSDQKIQIMKLSLNIPKAGKQNRLLRLSKRRAKCVQIFHNYISQIADQKLNRLVGKNKCSQRKRRTLVSDSSFLKLHPSSLSIFI